MDYMIFKRHMLDVQNLMQMQERINDATRNTEAEIWFPSLADNVIDLLEHIFDDTNGWISYFVYELEMGKNWTVGMITDSDGTDIKMQSIQDLWDMLQTNLHRCSDCRI